MLAKSFLLVLMLAEGNFQAQYIILQKVYTFIWRNQVSHHTAQLFTYIDLWSRTVASEWTKGVWIVCVNTAVGSWFYLSRVTFVHPILSYPGNLPFNMLMDERFILLVTGCINVTSTSVIRLRGLLALNEKDSVNMSVRNKVDSNSSKCNI